jgi:hypothetical protein
MSIDASWFHVFVAKAARYAGEIGAGGVEIRRMKLRMNSPQHAPVTSRSFSLELPAA